ncbi:hypothetical protein PtB15_9B584 [Puccinia triticina]|nr:hypothetical protein PtB15_9B584 [Puccinia triticina]
MSLSHVPSPSPEELENCCRDFHVPFSAISRGIIGCVTSSVGGGMHLSKALGGRARFPNQGGFGLHYAFLPARALKPSLTRTPTHLDPALTDMWSGLVASGPPLVRDAMDTLVAPRGCSSQHRVQTYR